MAAIKLFKRNGTYIDLSNLVEELGNIGLSDILKTYYEKPVVHDARSIVAGPSFIQYLNKIFKVQVAAGDILQFEVGDSDKYFMFSMSGTWDEIIKLQ